MIQQQKSEHSKLCCHELCDLKEKTKKNSVYPYIKKKLKFSNCLIDGVLDSATLQIYDL